ncbi:MAG: formate--tetrahydrofolate ligase [Candidatus Altiarchaeales archaeon]|nr:formate--tetrahydrofolate ligase [Candidatus Altiarchaeales archaeon]MBD3416731.1 formate--tetrahydrofolate ligase [Candidatus Altiarchaeales archaeon]
MKSDIEIAHSVDLRPVEEVAGDLGLEPDDLMAYGKFKAKLPVKLLERLKKNRDGKLVLVTSMTPTPPGEGKTTTTVGLTQALRKKDVNAVLCIREPSLGPVMGIKGGAAGGGYSQVLPMEDINLYFTGDIPAVSAANNLLSAVVDNHIFQGNELNINPNRVRWHRVTDMNDRSLRRIFVGLADSSGLAREDRYDITAASEVMAVLCLSESYHDLRERLARMVVGYTFFGDPVTVEQLKVQGAMAALLRDAFNPNLVQTMEGGPAIIHGGPFANIAHGCNSVVATKMALKLADVVVTEAGFGADLGAEKFFDIKCRQAGLKPDAVVLVATVRALKHHGGCSEYEMEDLLALEKGWPNLEKQIENVLKFNVPLVVAVNRFATDTDAEVDFVLGRCRDKKVDCALSEVHSMGGDGGLELAEAVLKASKSKSDFRFLYDPGKPIREKIEAISREIYGADGVTYTERALNEIRELEAQGLDKLPVCMSKTQKSLSDDSTLLGRPDGFKITVKKIHLSAGAGFIVVLTGKVMTMPGLPRRPAAEVIDIDDDGVISGLF